ncbi:MAG: MBL fold metallo-hydrolase, partial [Lysobacterales bacterium]
MIFKQFYLEALGHASYLLGSEETGDAFVLDVRRDVDPYFDFARQQGLTIRYAADTHQHNDYLTGITELEQRSPLELLAGARAELGYEARKLDDGALLRMGEIELEVLHTPGHTPEHISFLVRDRARGEDPVLLFSGGAL